MKKQKIVNELSSRVDLKLSSRVDLKSIIHEHTLFFDKLIELIPARFYLPTDDKDKPWIQGLSKTKRASMKQESKENIKKARRNRMDPERSNTTTLDLLKQSLENDKANAEKSNSEADDVEVEINPLLATGIENEERSVTYEELRQRLHRKIEELRSHRNLGDSNRAKKRIERSEYREKHHKRKRVEEDEEDKKAKDVEAAMKAEKDASEAAKELAFSHVKLGNEEEHEKKKRKLSKSKELEAAKKLEEAKKDPEKGEIITKKHSWNAATSRAAGVKIHDDPKLLKQSIHKEKKKHQKNASKWKERIETTEKMKAEKQQKRSKNISERNNEKKMRRIAKREKKLMRPGFEGRKQGFITEG